MYEAKPQSPVTFQQLVFLKSVFFLATKKRKKMHAWSLQGIPNGWERVPLSNPLGFKHHPLEGAGAQVVSNWFDHLHEAM